MLGRAMAGALLLPATLRRTDAGQTRSTLRREFESLSRVARGLVTAMGGRIWVSSREGEGSRFAFELPAAVADALTTSRVRA
jgi:signal transduction histidine kinase